MAHTERPFNPCGAELCSGLKSIRNGQLNQYSMNCRRIIRGSFFQDSCGLYSGVFRRGELKLSLLLMTTTSG